MEGLVKNLEGPKASVETPNKDSSVGHLSSVSDAAAPPLRSLFCVLLSPWWFLILPGFLAQHSGLFPDCKSGTRGCT